jgi:hypothetical protein
MAFASFPRNLLNSVLTGNCEINQYIYTPLFLSDLNSLRRRVAMSLSFLQKKSWHTAKSSNVKEVWLKEEEAKKLKKKYAERDEGEVSLFGGVCGFGFRVLGISPPLSHNRGDWLPHKMVHPRIFLLTASAFCVTPIPSQLLRGRRRRRSWRGASQGR